MTSNKSSIRVSPGKGSNGTWNPVYGSAFNRMLQSNGALSDDEKNTLVSETTEILGQCVNPNQPISSNTGLVIGYVQSGKTLSFTSVAALARDNKYQLVILLAGTTNNLVGQSHSRIRDDLQIDETREWKLFSTQDKGFQKSELDRVTVELSKWRRGNPRAKTIMIVSMKQHQHLESLHNLLSKENFTGVPVLLVDDEGDQAGINTKAKKDEESTTYSRIIKLRSIFPNHSYLSYTATPQAPLLISRIDALSPEFGNVLTPGSNYVGGQEFFVDSKSKYIEQIPESDVPDKDAPSVDPPKTLLSALREFFVGVAIGIYHEEDREGKNRSMMIHPAVPKDDHLMYARWVKNTKEHWKAILDDESHHAYEGLIKEFEATTKKLLQTYHSKVTFEELLPFLYDAVEETAVVELNTREKNKIPTIDWKAEYSWILVGGIGLDRGFTIEGLTVSYMPRSTGVGNADNIQQRARFFGYKKNYLGLCRIYLTRENIDAFTDYVTHEESVRKSIARHLESGRTLKDWRRNYFLDESLKPTRSSVILLEMYQSKGDGGWIIPEIPFDDGEIVADNRQVVEAMMRSFDYYEYKADGWNERQVIPRFSDEIKLAKLRPLLAKIRYKWPDDNLKHSALLLSLERILNEDANTPCSVFAFSGPWSGVDAMRTLSEKGRLQIFQGKNVKTNYPGAKAIVSQDQVTIQIHRYNIRTFNKKRTIHDVPTIAVHIPEVLAERVWIER